MHELLGIHDMFPGFLVHFGGLLGIDSAGLPRVQDENGIDGFVDADFGLGDLLVAFLDGQDRVDLGQRLHFHGRQREQEQCHAQTQTPRARTSRLPQSTLGLSLVASTVGAAFAVCGRRKSWRTPPCSSTMICATRKNQSSATRARMS